VNGNTAAYDLRKSNFTSSAVRGTAQALVISTLCPIDLVQRVAAAAFTLADCLPFAPLRLCEKPKKLLGF
jgi:hypothetical protein